MNGNPEENQETVSAEVNAQFREYDYERGWGREAVRREKKGLRKVKRGSQIKFI